MVAVLQRAAIKSLSPYGVMLNCPSTLYKVAIGMAADAGYTKVRKNSTHVKLIQ